MLMVLVSSKTILLKSVSTVAWAFAVLCNTCVMVGRRACSSLRRKKIELYLRTGITFSLTAFALAKTIASKRNRSRDGCLARPRPARQYQKRADTLMAEVIGL